MVASVACTRPPVRRHSRKQSTVPTRSACGRRTPETDGGRFPSPARGRFQDIRIIEKAVPRPHVEASGGVLFAPRPGGRRPRRRSRPGTSDGDNGRGQAGLPARPKRPGWSIFQSQAAWSCCSSAAIFWSAARSPWRAGSAWWPWARPRRPALLRAALLPGLALVPGARVVAWVGPVRIGTGCDFHERRRLLP